MSTTESLQWVQRVLMRTRGKELIGNYNPLVIGELFWEQSSKWRVFAEQHIQDVAQVCERFLNDVLGKTCPKDVKSRIWSCRISDALKDRHEAAYRELDLIMEDLTNFPINYNPHYTDKIHRCRQERQKTALTETLKSATEINIFRNPDVPTTDIEKAVKAFSARTNPKLENFGHEEVLDCLFAIYENFITNITTQVIERHIVRGLEKIFSPVVVNGMSSGEIKAVASEPACTKAQRAFLEDRIGKLKDGQEIIRGVMGSTSM